MTRPIATKFAYEFYTPDHLINQIYPCVVISLLNPHCFTIQLQEDAVEFDKFQREINQFYNTINDSQFHIQFDEIRLQLCVICSDQKSSETATVWNRCQILDIDPVDKTVNLFYVDLGSWEEYVPIHRLRHLIEIFHQPIVFSVTCRLADIGPINNSDTTGTWPEEATQHLLAVVNNVFPRIELLPSNINGAFRANLFVTNDGVDLRLNDYLVHIKQAKNIEDTIRLDNDTDQMTTQVRFTRLSLDF